VPFHACYHWDPDWSIGDLSFWLVILLLHVGCFLGRLFFFSWLRFLLHAGNAWIWWCSDYLFDCDSLWVNPCGSLLYWSCRSFHRCCFFVRCCRRFLCTDVPASLREAWGMDSLSSLNADLELLLGTPPTSPFATRWSFSTDSGILSHLSHSGSPLPEPPWIQDLRQGTSPSVGFCRRLVSWLVLLPSLHASPILDSTSSLADLFPLSVIHASVTVTWDPLCWRSRRLFCRMTRRYEANLDRLLHSSHLAAPSFDPPSSMSPEPHFVDSFDPAIAGVYLLMVGRYNDLLHVAPPPPNTVSLDLWANPTRHHAFPLIIDSVYSSSDASLDSVLVIDSGASCCISPCMHDFLSYSPSSALIPYLSGTNVVADTGYLQVLPCFVG